MAEPTLAEESAAFERAEQRLNEWGRDCRQTAKGLSLPTISGIAMMIAHVQRQDRLEKNARKKELRKARKAWKEGDESTDPKLIAEELGYTEKDLTAQGKEKRATITRVRGLNSRSLETDFVVSRIPKWAQKCIKRSYMYGQPDRFAASDLQIRFSEYSARRRAAVEQVAIMLEQRYIRRSCDTSNSSRD